MQNENETDIDQILEDSVFSDPMCLVELIGWALFIISLVIGLLVLKLSLPIEDIGWSFFVGGLSLAAWGGYKRDKSKVCSVMSERDKSRE